MYFNYQVVEKYKLGSPKTFHYLNQSKCHELVGVNDTQEYLATRRAMDIVGISETEQVRRLLLMFLLQYLVPYINTSHFISGSNFQSCCSNSPYW